MTEHERRCFDEALNKAKSHEWELRLHGLLRHKLEQTTWDKRFVLLRRVEQAIRGE